MRDESYLYPMFFFSHSTEIRLSVRKMTSENNIDFMIEIMLPDVSIRRISLFYLKTFVISCSSRLEICLPIFIEKFKASDIRTVHYLCCYRLIISFKRLGDTKTFLIILA